MEIVFAVMIIICGLICVGIGAAAIGSALSSKSKEGNMASLKSGDVVQLKSGGPLMTVEEDVDTGDDVLTCWFDYDGCVNHDEFSYAWLNKMEVWCKDDVRQELGAG